MGRFASRMLKVSTAVGIAAFAITGCAAHPSTTGAGAGQSPDPLTGNVGDVSGSGGPNPSGTPTSTPTTHSTTTGSGGGGGNSGPQIVYFRVSSKPACPVVGTADAPFSTPGQDITLEWKVTGASGIALSIDDPNFFKNNHSGSWDNYGKQDHVTLSFPCDTSKPTSTHTYTLDTLGGSPYKEKTITVSTQSNP